jgi:hypothetical protein
MLGIFWDRKKNGAGRAKVVRVEKEEFITAKMVERLKGRVMGKLRDASAVGNRSGCI